MKIAFTADVHLRTREEHTERYNALANILNQMLDEEISTLIIAGDLFDLEMQNYSEFDDLCRQPEYRDLKIYVLPGNHDPGLDQKFFTSGNLRILNKPEIFKPGDESLPLLILPYKSGYTMGEFLAEYKSSLPDRWILVSHGDYLSGLSTPNPYEPGVYMPLSRMDIRQNDPAVIILGHIHKKMDLGRVHYPGSPCGLDITETGRRSFIILDTNSLDISSKPVETDRIFFNETIIALPVTNEFDYIVKKISEMKTRWEIGEEDYGRIFLRIKIRGYTSDKRRLDEVIRSELKDFGFYKDEGPDLSEVNVHSDVELIRIVEKVEEEIGNMDPAGITVSREDIMEQALYLIFGKQ